MQPRLPFLRAALAPSCCAFLLAAAGVFFLGGCAAQGFVITLKDGRQFISSDKPELNLKTGYYKFRDRYGRDVLMREDEVLMIHADTGGGKP